MDSYSLPELVTQQVLAAGQQSSGRASTTLHGGSDHVLRQTLTSLLAGQQMDEHESPGEATLQVLAGRVSVRSADQEWEGRTGDLLIVPPQRHSLHALEDSVVLLTTVKKPHTAEQTPRI